MSAFDIDRAIRLCAPGQPFRSDYVLDVLNARLVADGLNLTGATAPSIQVASSFARLRWAANAAITAGPAWNVQLPGEFGDNDGKSGSPQDEIQLLLCMQSTTGGTNPGKFTPQIFRQRVGTAVSAAAIACTSFKKASSLDALEAAAATAATDITLSDNPSQPELVLVTFFGKGFKGNDSLQVQLIPAQNNNHQVDLFGAVLRIRRHAGLRRVKSR